VSPEFLTHPQRNHFSKNVEKDIFFLKKKKTNIKTFIRINGIAVRIALFAC